VRLMGGEVGASSQPGQGSTFWFTTTLALGQGRAPVQPASQQDAGALLRQRHHGAQVLVVEDNAVNREVAEALLQATGLRVDSVENGRLALERLQQRAYDLVLMDMQLPEMDGLEATRAIRRDPALARLPILATTANAFAEDRMACLAAGMSDFVAKPVNPADLYAAILRCLDSAAPQPAQATAGPQAARPAPHAGGVARQSPGPDPAPADLLAAITGLLGAEVPATLARLRGNLPMYDRLLRQFVQRQRQDPAQIARLLQQQQPAEAGQLVHALKGAAATLGAARLADLAAALELRLRTPGAPADAATLDLAAALGAEMQRLADGVAHWPTVQAA